MALSTAGRSLVVAAVAMALSVSPASAADSAPASFSLTFSTTTPGAPADVALYILYKDPEDPDDPEGRSPALTSVTIAAPPGTVFHGDAVAACPASDLELMLLGTAACPSASHVGGGSASVVTTPGPPIVFPAEVGLFNYGEGIIELLEFAGGAIKVVDRARFEDESPMVLNRPVVPGITEREFDFTYRGMRGGDGRPYITTPPECPPSGEWTSRLTYTVTTGATYSTTSTTPCTPSSG